MWFYLGEIACWAADSSVQKWNLLRASEQTFIQWDLSWIMDDSEIAVVCMCAFFLEYRGVEIEQRQQKCNGVWKKALGL